MNLARRYKLARRCGSCGRRMHFAPDAPECVECETRRSIEDKDAAVEQRPKLTIGKTRWHRWDG